MSLLTKLRRVGSSVCPNKYKYGPPSSDYTIHHLSSTQSSHTLTTHLPSQSSLHLGPSRRHRRQNKLHAKPRTQNSAIILRILKNILRVNTATLNTINSRPPKPLVVRHPSINEPETLVAIAAFTANYHGDEDDIQNDYNHVIKPAKDLTQGTDEKYKGTALLLDTIATLCIHEHKPRLNHVFATALQVDEGGGKVRLVIGGNHNVPEIITPHLKQVWYLLRDISKQASKKIPGTPSGMGDKNLESTIRVLQRTLYTFSSRLFVARLNPNSAEFKRYANVLKKIHLKSDAGPEVLRWGKILADVIETIENNLAPLIRKLETSQLTKSEWKVFCTMMDGILKNCQALFDNDRACEALVKVANEIDKTIPTKFALRRYLQTMISLHHNIASLTKSARSPLLQTIFIKKLSVHCVPPKRSILDIPTTWKGFEEVINSVVHQEGYTILDPASFYKKSAGNSSCNLGTSGIVHCECLLIEYFDSLQRTSEPWAKTTPFQYIGVSKPSCQGCDSWFRAYNVVTGKSFSTRGVRQRWFFPWGRPQLGLKRQEEQVKEYMFKDTMQKYCQYQEKMGVIHSQTTNTNSVI